MEKKNKEFMIKKLMEKTGKTEAECRAINDVLEDHFIIGRNNKDKIVADFIKSLNMSEEEADETYNNCAEVIMKNILK